MAVTDSIWLHLLFLLEAIFGIGYFFFCTSTSEVKAKPILESYLKTLQITDWSYNIVTSATRDILHTQLFPLNPDFKQLAEIQLCHTAYTTPYYWEKAEQKI